MKKLRKLLALMLTVLICFSTVADTGFAVLAADDDEAAAEEPDGAPGVKRLIVNGIDMLEKPDQYLHEDGTPFEGEPVEGISSYMIYHKDSGTLTLNRILLNGTVMNPKEGSPEKMDDCAVGIDYIGDRLEIEVIGACFVNPRGIAGEECYGIRVGDNSNLVIKSVLDDAGDRRKGHLYVGPSGEFNSGAKWVSSIYFEGKGNLTFLTPDSAEGDITNYETDHNGLRVDLEGSDVVRYGSGGEIEGDNITIQKASVIVKAAASAAGEYSYGVSYDGKLDVDSGYLQVEMAGSREVEESKAIAICGSGDMTVGEDAYVSARGSLNVSANESHGLRLNGRLTVRGRLKCSGGKTPAVYAEKGIRLEGTSVSVPYEGVIGDGCTIKDQWGNDHDYVEIRKGQYYDTWVGGRRLASWITDLSAYVWPGTARLDFDPDTNTLTFDQVLGMYFTSQSPTLPKTEPMIYSTKPLNIRGEGRIDYDGVVVNAAQGVPVNIDGNFTFVSLEENAVQLKAAELTIEGSDTVLTVESKKKSGIYCGVNGSSITVKDGLVNAKGATNGMYCDGDIRINGREVNAEGGEFAIKAFGSNVVLDEELDVTEPAGGMPGTVKSGNNSIGTIVDTEGKAAKNVKLVGQEYDLWLGRTLVTSANRKDILGDGTASYDPASRTLTLNGVESIPGNQSANGIGPAKIYSEHALNIRGSADIHTENNVIVIAADIMEEPSTIEGDFSFESVAGGVLIPASVLYIQGEGTTLKAKTSGLCIDCFGLALKDATVDLNSTDNGAIFANAAVALDHCELMASGDVAALAVKSDQENALIWSEGMEILEPDEGRKEIIEGNTTIVDASGKVASTVHIGESKGKVTVSVEAVDRDYEKGNLGVQLKNAKLSGVAKGDQVDVELFEAQALMQDDLAGNNKPVTVSGIRLSGKDADKYRVVQPTDVTVNIAKAEWTQTKTSYVVANADIGKDLSISLTDPEFCAPGAYAVKAEADKKKNQLDGAPALDESGKVLSFKLRSDTAAGDINTLIRISMSGALNHKDYTLELTLVGEHEHSGEQLTLVEEVKAGCETEGIAEHYVCGLCGKMYTFDGTVYHEATDGDLRIAALGHDWDDDLSEIIVYPTETKEGLRRVHCARTGCVKYKDVVIPKNTKVHRPSPMNPVPENLEFVTKLTLVKGQSFTIPGSGWKCVEKKDKKYVSVSKKGKFKAKKATDPGMYARITDGSRVIEITVVQPAFSDRSLLKLEAKGTPEPAALGFNAGDAELGVWYTSSAADVAAVDQDGTVTALTAGTSTITAYVNGKAYTRKVKVTEPAPLAERFVHATVNVKKSLKIKGFKVAQWTAADPADKENLEFGKNSVKALKVKDGLPGYYPLVGLDKDGNPLCTVKLIVEDPVIDSPAVVKKGNNKYEIRMLLGEIVYLPFKSVDQPVTFKSSKGAVAYADYGPSEKLTVFVQSKGKCKLSTKINGKTITIQVKVE